jgi:hypothetical protein
MSSGLIAFLVLAPVVVWVTYAIVGWLNYRENPLWWRSELKMLDVDDVRWVQFSPKFGEGHIIGVVTGKDVKTDNGKHRITFDRYIKKGDKYVFDASLDYSIADFFRFTDAEPTTKDERIK